VSSCIYVTFDEDEGVTGEAWTEFCREHGIRYSPQTVGQNVFYAGDVEIHFGAKDGTAPTLRPGGGYDWDTAKPPDYAEEITFRTVYGHALERLAELARTFWLQFGGAVCAEETLRHLFATGTGAQRRTVIRDVIVRDQGEITA
jgi:hypothetical protein